MQIFMRQEWKLSATLLFVSLYVVVITPMHTTISSCLCFKPEKIITIFDHETELAKDKSWREVVPGTIMITPDGKGCVTGEYGRVCHFLFDDTQDDKPKVVIEHPCAKKYIPMIAMAQKNDGSLMIVSAGNYTNSDKKSVSEYIVFCNEWSKVEKLDWSVQAISLDSYGKRLAIAGLSSILVVDFETNQTDELIFEDFLKDRIWIKDIALHKTGGSIIGVGSQQGIQLMSVMKNDDEIDVSILTQVESADAIRKIYYPTSAELLCLTQDGKAKTINMHDLLKLNNEKLKGTDFSHPSLYDMVVADPSESIATAHWTSKINTDHKIKVYRKSNQCIEKFILEMPTITEQYSYITECGNRAQGIGHLLHVAIRGNCVVALATDGKMRVWSLPEERSVYNQVEKHEKLPVFESPHSTKDMMLLPDSGRQSRSISPSGRNKYSKHIVTMTNSDDSREKKNVFSRIKVFSSSREGSPARKGSRESSPVRVLLNEDV